MFLGVVPQCPQSVCIVNLCVFVITHGFSMDTQTPSKAWLDCSVLPWPLSPQASKQWILLFCTLQALIFLSCSFLPVGQYFFFSFLSLSQPVLAVLVRQRAKTSHLSERGAGEVTPQDPRLPTRSVPNLCPFQRCLLGSHPCTTTNASTQPKKHLFKVHQSTDGNHGVTDALSLLKHVNLRAAC